MVKSIQERIDTMVLMSLSERDWRERLLGHSYGMLFLITLYLSDV